MATLAVLLLAILTACTGRFSPRSSSDSDDGQFEGEVLVRVGLGLVQAVPAQDEVAIRWRVPDGEVPGFGIFLGTDPASLFDGPPVLVDPTGTTSRLGGLTPGVEYHVGMATRIGARWVRLGNVHPVRPGLIIYVDPQVPDGGSGTSPDSPFDDLLSGLLTAFALGGGNVWVAEGVFEDIQLQVPDRVDVYGGFTGGFDLDTRDPLMHATVLRGREGEDILAIESTSKPCILEGLSFDGSLGSKNGLDVDDVSADLRALEFDGLDRGIRLRAIGVREISVTACTFVGCRLEGLSGEGSFELDVDGSAFIACGQEGLDLEDLVAPDGESVRLRVRQSVFAGCGEEGLDCDLAAPLTGAVGGEFEVEILECDFIGNDLSGCLIDIDYETAPLWSSTIQLAGCLARGNGKAGVSLDLDARSDVLLQRLACVANGSDGLLVTSESADGLTVVGSSLFLGNQGWGVRTTLGFFPALVSNSVFAGNASGGMVASAVDGSVVSSVAYQQSNPWQGVLDHVNLLVSLGDPPAFLNAPEQILRILGRIGLELTLEGTPVFAAGAPCEVDADDLEREALAVVGNVVTLSDVNGISGAGRVLTAFEVGSSVLEDYAPSPASVLLGGGLPSPGGAPTDSGPFGAPFGGQPGTAPADALSEKLFPSRLTPKLGVPLDPNESITVSFSGGPVAAGSLGEGVSVVDSSGSPVAASFSVDGSGALVVFPAATGWASGDVLRLHRGLRSTDGLELATEVAVPVLTP